MKACSMKVYIVIEVGDPPRILGVYRTRVAAEKAAYKDSTAWRNVIERMVEG